jgi:hypothetical protein
MKGNDVRKQYCVKGSGRKLTDSASEYQVRVLLALAKSVYGNSCKPLPLYKVYRFEHIPFERSQGLLARSFCHLELLKQPTGAEGSEVGGT